MGDASLVASAQQKVVQLESAPQPPQTRAAAAPAEIQRLEKKLDRDWESVHNIENKLAQQRLDLDSTLHELERCDAVDRNAIAELHLSV